MNDYFSHDYYSRCIPKLQSVLMKRGLEGIGLYWCAVEMLYENQGFLSPDDIERIAFELRCPYDIVNDIIHNYNLFVVKDKRFFSKGVMKRLKLRKLKSEQARENVSKRWSKHKENQEVGKDTNVKQTYNEANSIKNEIKINEKEKVLDFDTKNSIPSLTEVEDFFLKNSTNEEAKKFFTIMKALAGKSAKIL